MRSELTEARIAVRLAELRVLAAETAYEYGRAHCNATARWLLEPPRARSPERAFEVWQHRRGIEAAVRRRLRG